MNPPCTWGCSAPQTTTLDAATSSGGSEVATFILVFFITVFPFAAALLLEVLTNGDVRH